VGREEEREMMDAQRDLRVLRDASCWPSSATHHESHASLGFVERGRARRTLAKLVDPSLPLRDQREQIRVPSPNIVSIGREKRS